MSIYELISEYVSLKDESSIFDEESLNEDDHLLSLFDSEDTNCIYDGGSQNLHSYNTFI